VAHVGFYQLLQGQLIDGTNVFSEKLQEWEDYSTTTALTALLPATP
jgi:hypothetical protein